MAHSGFCSNAQIIKSLKKKLKDLDFYLVSPEMLFLEELYIFLQECASIEELDADIIIKNGKQKYKELSKSEQMRYVKLAEEMNAQALED